MADVYLSGRAAPRSWRIAHFGQKKTQNKFSTENRLIECPALHMAPGPTIQPILKFPVRNSEVALVSDKIYRYTFALWNWKKVDIKMHPKLMKLNQEDVKNAPNRKLDYMQAAPIQGLCSTRVDINLSKR